MALGLPRALIEAEVSKDLIYSGLDQRTVMKISHAIADAIDKNNRLLQKQLAASGIDGLQAIINGPQPIIPRAGVI